MKSKNEKRWHPFRSKPERICSEAELPGLARELAQELRPGDRLILEGSLGAGKSTLIQHLLQALSPGIESQGSPTFAVTWSYQLGGGAVPRLDHSDLYRLEDEAELEAAGMLDLLWNPETVVAIEWLSQFPEIETRLKKNFPWLKIEIEPCDSGRRYRFSF